MEIVRAKAVASVQAGMCHSSLPLVTIQFHIPREYSTSDLGCGKT